LLIPPASQGDPAAPVLHPAFRTTIFRLGVDAAAAVAPALIAMQSLPVSKVQPSIRMSVEDSGCSRRC
jgi:hypothetical protein